MPDEDLQTVSSRDLRNKTAEVIGRVEQGESLIVTVDRRPVARLVPLPARTTWVPKERIVAEGGFIQTDPGFAEELREMRKEDQGESADRTEKLWPSE